MSSYYMLRPLREEMGLAGGVRNLPRLFMVTLAAMAVVAPLLGWLVRRYRREVFIPLAYRVLGSNLLIFFAVMHLAPESSMVTVGRVFYVWLSVYNLFILSLFWAFMVDLFGYPGSRRFFGIIAVGGTMGAILGAGLTEQLVPLLGRANLMLLAVVLLEGAVRCVGVLSRRYENAPTTVAPEPQKDRGMWAGVTLTLRSPYLLGIGGYLFLYSLTSTFLYFEQAEIVSRAVAEGVERAVIFARIDLWTNILTLAGQLFVTGRLLKRLGTGMVLALLPVLVALGFTALGLWPVLAVLVVFQVVRRAGNYAFAKPARETLFAVVDRESRYKAKNFLDTFVYRAGDALGAGIFSLLTATGAGLTAIAWTAVPLALVWSLTGVFLGRRQRRLADDS